MTEYYKRLAIKHLAAFAASEGDPNKHLDYFEKNFSSNELGVGVKALLEDSDARPLMIGAYRKLDGVHNYTREPDGVVVEHIIRQINLMRSGAINGMFGNMDGLEE